jgi:hypothetical protein
VKRIRAMEKMTMTMAQVMVVGIDLFDSPEFEDESKGVNRGGVVGIVGLVASRGVRVVVVNRTCEEKEADVDEKIAELEGRDEELESRDTEINKACEGRDADCADRGRERESLAELDKVGRALNNVIVARAVGTIGFAILEVLTGRARREERERENLHD